MTREEAIKELKIIREDYWDEYEDPMPALDMAIKALEQEPCEDCISRKAILDCQYTIDESETLGISTKNVVNVDDILNAKPVTPQTKTGHWIHLKHNKGKCSKCHDVVLIAQQYGNANYCPNCGAKMVETHEGSDKE